MHYRKLGATEAEVSELGYGAWGIGGNQSRGGDEESLRALKRAFELGVNFVDTALPYGEGHSEQLVGRAVKEAYQRVFVATKIPPKNRIWPAHPATPISEVFPYDYILSSTDHSLSNLGVEQIYLQQFQVWTDAWVNTDEWRRAVEVLRQSGKVRYFGISVSEHDPDSALEAVKTGVLTAVEVIYNIFEQSAEKNLFPLCQTMKVGVLARVPLEEGDRKREVDERVEALKRDLADFPAELPEIAIRFCLSHKAVTSVIPGMRRVETVESYCRAAAAGMLDEKTLAIFKRHALARNFCE